jgi:hypothetical protein
MLNRFPRRSIKLSTSSGGATVPACLGNSIVRWPTQNSQPPPRAWAASSSPRTTRFELVSLSYLPGCRGAYYGNRGSVERQIRPLAPRARSPTRANGRRGRRPRRRAPRPAPSSDRAALAPGVDSSIAVRTAAAWSAGSSNAADRATRTGARSPIRRGRRTAGFARAGSRPIRVARAAATPASGGRSKSDACAFARRHAYHDRAG